MKGIVNFGALNLDFVYSVDKIVKPGETISSNTLKTFCGGKGLNQSAAIAKAGGIVYHAGRYGKNDGKILADTLLSASVKTIYLETEEGPSGHAIIQVDANGQNCIMLYGGANQTFTEKYVDRVLEKFGADDILLVQNEINIIPYIIKKAKERGMTIAFNPSPMDEKISAYPLELIDIFILNEIEGSELTGESRPEDICDKLLELFPKAEIVLTLGKQGCVYCKGDVRIEQETYSVAVVDTTAAGDTFTGYYLASRISGDEPGEAIRIATAAASLAVTKAGAFDSIPYLCEVETFMKDITEYI